MDRGGDQLEPAQGKVIGPVGMELPIDLLPLLYSAIFVLIFRTFPENVNTISETGVRVEICKTPFQTCDALNVIDVPDVS